MNAHTFRGLALSQTTQIVPGSLLTGDGRVSVRLILLEALVQWPVAVPPEILVPPLYAPSASVCHRADEPAIITFTVWALACGITPAIAASNSTAKNDFIRSMRIFLSQKIGEKRSL